MNQSVVGLFKNRKIVFFLFVFILQFQSTNALLITCPGRPNTTLNWSSSNVSASSCTLTPSYSDPINCAYSPAPDTPGSRSVVNGTSCNVSLVCGSASDSDILEYHPELTWNGTACATPPQPDLTAGSITPTNATAGSAVTLSSTISNIGATTTGAGFTNLFQKATDSSGTGSTDIGTFVRGSALVAGGSFNATLSYTFSTAGTSYIRACADKSSAGNAGAISESNEGNNCTGWIPITVAARVVRQRSK
jgi:hypothetical protein